MVISSGGAVRHRYDAQYAFGQIGKVNPGQTQNFQFQGQISSKIINYTAIGRITARYFVIVVKTAMGCCNTDPYALIHIVINSKNPSVMNQKKVPPPENWYPQQYPKIVYNNMKPFIYSPLAAIPFRNVPTGNGGNMDTLTSMNSSKEGVKPYFKEATQGDMYYNMKPMDQEY